MAQLSPLHWLPGLRPAPAAQAATRFDAADFRPPLQTQLLILQPTPFCNIACDYCYLPERSNPAKMSLATVRQAARRLREDGLAGPQLTVVWHAGEPLAMPHEFYEEAIAALHEELAPACEPSHAIQTNAMLIDERWCELFKRHQIRIGVSVDGPAALHDAHRHTRQGQATHARVLQGMALLRAHAIDFHAIAVVTPATFAQAQAFIAFFEDQGISELGCNFDEAEGPHLHSSLSGHEAAHAEFVAALLAHCQRPGSRLRVRELANALQLLARPLPQTQWQGQSWPFNAQTLPFALVSVAHNGDFSSFSPELLGQPSAEFGNFILGNVAEQGFLQAAGSAGFARLWAAIRRGTLACQATCAHYGFCGGGAPANKLFENGNLTSAETLYCRSMIKRPFDAVLAQLERDRAMSMMKKVSP